MLSRTSIVCTTFATSADTSTAADNWQSRTYSNTAPVNSCQSPRASGTCSSLVSGSQIFLVLTATTAASQGVGVHLRESAAKPLHATSWPPSPDTRPHWMNTCTRGFVSFPTPEDRLWTLASRRCTKHTHDRCGKRLTCTLQWTPTTT